MTKKMTKKEMFAEIITVVEGSAIETKAEMLKFLEHEIELLNRKSSKSGPTKAQLENEKLAEELYEALSTMTEPVTISEFQEKSVYPIASKSNQKLTSLMKKLMEEGKVARVVEKKKAYYTAL